MKIVRDKIKRGRPKKEPDLNDPKQFKKRLKEAIEESKPRSLREVDKKVLDYLKRARDIYCDLINVDEKTKFEEEDLLHAMNITTEIAKMIQLEEKEL